MGPVENRVLKEFRSKGLAPQRWSNGPYAVYGLHDHPYAKILACVEGSIEFELPQENRRLTLNPGDFLRLAAHTPHCAVAGPHGVVCLEAHVEAPSSR